MVVEQICCKRGVMSKHHAVREEIKLRIAEVRDDVMKEPTLSVSEKKEIYVQQMHTRPGRLRGKRLAKKGKNQEDMTPEEVAQTALLEKQKDALRDSLQISRDMDYPVRYAILDPYGTSLVEVHNISPDCTLIEQLYTEIDGSDVLRQIQALRSLARMSHAHPATTLPVPPAAVPTGGEEKEKETRRHPDPFERNGGKSIPLQLKALNECLLGVSNNASLSFERGGLLIGPHNSYVRAEAAFQLATWQNERAPKVAPTGTADSLPALTLLLAALKYLFVNPYTGLPLPNDFCNESSTHLRTSLLFAISTVRTYSGLTPDGVISALLLFAEHNANEGSEGDEEGPDASDSGGHSFAQRTPLGLVYDDRYRFCCYISAVR